MTLLKANLPSTVNCLMGILIQQAISIKESQLMGKISLDLEFEGHDETNPVWIISPKQDFPGSADAVDANISNLNGDGSVGLPDSPTDVSVDNEVQDLVELNSMSVWDKNEILRGFEGISSYKELLSIWTGSSMKLKQNWQPP
ncbi:hypothetical protein AKJ16_DCAP11148 [Drosera capensis]